MPQQDHNTTFFGRLKELISVLFGVAACVFFVAVAVEWWTAPWTSKETQMHSFSKYVIFFIIFIVMSSRLPQKLIVICFVVLGAVYGQWTWKSSSDEFQQIDELWAEIVEIEMDMFNRAKRVDAKALEKIAEPPILVKPTHPVQPPAPMKPAAPPKPTSKPMPKLSEPVEAPPPASLFDQLSPEARQLIPRAILLGAEKPLFTDEEVQRKVNQLRFERIRADRQAAEAAADAAEEAKQRGEYAYKWRIEVILRKIEMIRHKLAQDGVIYPIRDETVTPDLGDQPERVFNVSTTASWERTIGRMALIGLIFGFVAAIFVYPLGTEQGILGNLRTESTAAKSDDSSGNPADVPASTKTGLARTVMGMKCTWMIVTIIILSAVVELPNEVVVTQLMLNLFVIALLGSVLEPRFGSRNLVLLAVIGIVVMGATIGAVSIAGGHSGVAPIAAASISWTLIGALCILPLRNSRNFLSWEENVTILAVGAVILLFGYQLTHSPQWIMIGGQFTCLPLGVFFGSKLPASIEPTQTNAAR